MKLKQFIFALVAMLSGFAFTANAQVAKVGDTGYSTIDEAIANWTNGSTLTLLADVQLSDVIKLSSTEYHILDLGTYTMTAAKNKDAIQYVVNGRSSASYALDIKADATKPGGITATGKAIITHTKPLISAPSKDRPITRFYGGVFNASNIVKQGGTFGAGYTGASAPYFYFYGGEFNGTIYTNRSIVHFYGGTFNGSLQMSVDSSSYGLVAGGKFKNLSNLFGSALNSDKFTIGSAKATYDRGIYVDKDGYYVITSAPITEVSAKYPAVKKENYDSNNYFYYSAAAANGMFYEVASKAGTGSNVEVYEHAEVVEELDNNAAVKDFTPELPSEVVTFEVEAIDIEATTEATTKVTFNVEPKDASGAKVSDPSAAITFRLPVPAAWAGKQVYVSHDGDRLDGTYAVQTGNYVEVTSASFSEFAVEPVPPVAKIGNVEYTTLAEAVAAAGANETITLLADVTLAERVTIPAGKTLTIDLNGKSISMEESIIATAYAINNLGNLTITDGVGGGSINARGVYNGYGDGGANVASATITVLGGTFNAKGTNGGAAIFNYGTANVKGGKFTSIGGYSLNNQAGANMNIADGVEVTGGIYNNQDAELTVNGGNISNNRSGCHTIYAWNAKVTVNGGSIHNENSGNATIMSAGTSEVTINGGTISIKDGRVPGNGNTWTSCLTDAANTAKIIVNGGTLNGGVRVQSGATMTINGGSFNDVYGSNYNIYGTVTVTGGTFTDDTAKTFASKYIAAGYELNADGTVAAKPVAEVNGVKYASFADAAAAAQAGNEIKLLANIEGDITVPAGVIFNGNGFAVSGVVTAAGEITFAGVTKVGNFGVQYVNTTVNILAGASLELTGTGRMVIGHGCTFNITGTIADAKTANVADVTPSLVMPGASFTGTGVTFNVTGAYISAPSSYCSSSKSASGTFDFNINNSIWECAGKLAFEAQSTAAKVDFALVNSVLNTGSHLLFSTASGEEGVVIDNSLVNEGTARQLENRGTMTIKNGSVVNGAVATSSNAINPGTIIVENATYAVTGEFSGAAVGTGTLIIKKGANVSVGSITKANIKIDATDMGAGDEINLTANLSKFAGTLSVINNDKLEAQIVDGKVVLAAKPVAKIGEQGYATLDEAFAAAAEDATITLLDNATPALASQRAITKAAVIDLGGKTMTLTEDDLYFGTTTFKNGTIVVDPSVKPSTAVFWMFANQTLTFDNVKIVATGVTGTYLIGLEGDNSDLNLLNGSEILVENTTALDLDIICVNGTNTCDIKVENSKVNVKNLDGRVFFRGNYTVKDSEVNLAGITKAGFRIEAGQTLSIEGTSKVNIEGEPRDGGIHITDISATYTKAETATVNATVNEPKVAKVGENTYRTLAQAVAAVEDGGTITLIANEIFTATNYSDNGGWKDGLYYVGDKSFTIDLGGFTIGQNGYLNDYLMNFKNVGSKDNTITIKNGTLDAGTTAYCALCTSSSHENKLTINTEELNIINNISNGSTVKVRGGAVLNVNDGTVITGKNSYLGIECLASTVNIYDGAEIYMNGTSSYNGCLVGVCGGGTVNVYGGYGKGVKGGFIAMTSGGTINISGGEWIANTDGTVGNNSNLYVLTAQSNKYESGFVGASIINVTGGTLRGGMDAWVLNNLEGEKAELNIKGGNFNVNPARFVAEGYLAKEDNGVWTVVKAVAKVGETAYASLEEAFKAATEDCEIVILDNVTVDYNWDARYTGAKFTVPVTINGNGKTIKFTASVNDNNYQAPFRFEADATVKNLTIDMSEVTDNRFRAISSKGNLTVDGCKFIGKDETLNCRAIIFGEGAGANVGNLAIAITNSEFINWKRGITDNENAQDVKTVTITGNTLTDAGVGVSAKETVTFTGNTVAGAYVNIKSYTAGNKLAVTATGNTLEANTEIAYNVIDAGGVVNAEGFNVVAKGGNMIGYTSTEGIYGEVWGNSRESFVIKVVDAQGNVMGTTSLNNVGGIIDGDVYVTWNIKFNAAANTDEYWTMAWTTAPSIDNMPAKVQLWVDGTNVSEGDVVLNGPDNLWPIAVAVTDAEGNILSCHGTIAAAVAANATNIALLRDTDEVIKLPLGVTLDKNGFTADGVTVTLPVAKIGEHNFASVNDALAYAKEAGLTNLEITIIGTNDASTTDSFDLVYTTLFDNVTIKQENGGVAYYIYDLYTGSRTNDGQFVFDGVNIVVTDQYMFEGNVKLSNNSLITSVAEANCFVYNAEVTVEAGSKIDGVIEDIRGGSLIIDGGKTDGTYCETPGLLDAILVVNWADSKLVLKNGAYVNINSANEVGRLTVNGTLDVTDSKLDAYQWINVNKDATMNLNAGSVVTTKKVEGAGKITVDATGLEGTVTVINGDMAGFTGAIEIVGNEYASYSITAEGLVINSSFIAELTLVDGEEFSNDSEKTVGKLTYVRTLPAAGKWYPVFLPFDVPVDALAEKFDVARINDLHTNFSDEDGSIVKMWVEYIVKKSGKLAAGKPFLVRAKNSAELEMSIVLEEVKLYPASKKSTITVSSAITEVTFEGVYEVINSPVSTPSTRYMAVNADGVWDEFNTYSLNPFRVMMTLNILDEEYYIKSTASLSVGSRVVGEENEDGTTTIYDVFVDRENDGTIYDLQGRKVLEITEPGIYIINGKKVLVK